MKIFTEDVNHGLKSRFELDEKNPSFHTGPVEGQF